MIKKLDNGNYALEVSEDILNEIQYSIYVMAAEQGEVSPEIVEFFEELAEQIGSDEDELETVRNANVGEM